MGKKIIVIGGGPAGYSAAIKAAQLGADVTLVEENKIGGTCLNAGCVPAKSLLHTAGFYGKAAENAVPGVTCTGAAYDWGVIQEHKENIVKQLSSGVGALLKHNGVKVLDKKAVPLSPKQVRVGDEVLSADAVVLALGSVNTPLAFPGAGNKHPGEAAGVLDSTGALELKSVPESLIIVGGGVIGVEFAELFNSLGVKITIIEMASQLLPAADAEIAEYIKANLEAKGVAVHTNSQILDCKMDAGRTDISLMSNSKKQSTKAEKLLVAVGRRPNTAGAGLEKLGIKMSHGAIDTDEVFQTSVQGVYAVGDCNGKTMLAHAAMAQGEIAAEHIMGVEPHIKSMLVPSCIFTSPEIAFIGRTEEQLKTEKIEYRAGRFSLAGNARAILEGADGFVKILTESKYGEILGVHIIGPCAAELIAEAALCMSMEGTAEDIANAVHAHPTVSEAMREAAMSVFGKAIHGF